VNYYQFAKTEIAAQEREKQKSDVARNRHEFRLQRLEREKLERAARHDQKKAALTTMQSTKASENVPSSDSSAESDPKQAVVERAKIKNTTATESTSRQDIPQ
jgi:electron transport complex protein RnfC